MHTIWDFSVGNNNIANDLIFDKIFILLIIFYINTSNAQMSDPNFDNFMNSDDEGAIPMGANMMEVSDDDEQFKIKPENNIDQFAINQNNFEPTNNYKQTKINRVESIKKQLGLEETLIQIQQRLSEKSSIENKISGLKALAERIKLSKVQKSQISTLLDWIQGNKLINNLLHEDAHPQILRNMPIILKFLYENNRIDTQWVHNFTLNGLKSHQQFIKVIQSLLNFVKIDDLCTIFQMISKQTEIQNPNLATILSTIVGSKSFAEQSFSEINKKIKQNEKQLNDQNNNNILSQQMFNQENYEQRDFQDETEIRKEVQQPINNASKLLALNLFKFLIEATDKQMNTYYPILNKLITLKHSFLTSELSSTLPDLLKKGKVNAVWILQHCLKMDFGQSSKQKGSKNQARFNFILKLVNQHLYQYLLIILSRTRFNKVVVDKILNILILLSKNYKPLDDVYTQYIWKILGLNSRQQKQRQQFFNFVRDILRNQSNFTQQSVYFIFFQVLMSLKADWFSLKILDCLQMLFMRLNEDLKLISYVNQTYEIQDPDLVGIDKLWYIYFHSNDSKVTKKCKDFLWKLATYSSTSDIKIKLLKQYVDKISHFMLDEPQEMRVELCNKGFDIIDKMMEQTQKKEGAVQYVQIHVKNQCSQATVPKNVSLRLPEKCCLSHLRQQISNAINPVNTKIKLLLRGQFLKGQKMTLKDLSIQNGNTIMVVDDFPTGKPVKQNNQSLQNTIKQLEQILGSEMEVGLLKFIAEKMEGYDIEKIMDTIMNQQKLDVMTLQYRESLEKQEEKVRQGEKAENFYQPIIDEDEFTKKKDGQEQQMSDKNQQKLEQMQQQEKPIQFAKFSSVIVSHPQYIKQLLYCASQGNQKRGWQTIKNLPNSPFFISQIKKNCESKNWHLLFPKEQFNDMACIYNAHLLRHILKADKAKMKKYMITNGGFGYLMHWIRRVCDQSSNILLQQITNILVIILEEDCSALAAFRNRVNKKQESRLLYQLIQQSRVIIPPSELSSHGEQNLLTWFVNLLLSSVKNTNCSHFPSTNICELIIYYVLASTERLQNLLELPINEIHFIIHLHGFAGEYIFLIALCKLLSQQSPLSEKYSRKLLSLSDFCFDYLNQLSMKPNVVYIYDIIACILDFEVGYKQAQTQVTQKCIQFIRDYSQTMEVEQFTALLDLLRASENKFYYLETTITQQLNDRNVKFASWLFTHYLFDFEQPNRHMRNKVVRRICYQILQKIANARIDNSAILIEEVLKIEIHERNKDQDYIDFRSQDYIGLTNLGATCYINSLLQQIYHTKFSKLLLQKGDKMPEQEERMKQLKKIFMKLCYSIKNVVNPRQFIKNMSFYGEPINTCVQQDATEFLLCLFDYIESEGCQSQVYEVFGGHLCNQITVDGADNNDQEVVKNNLEHFNSLTIDIKGKKNLQQALAYLIKPQILDGENKYFCQQLGKKMKAEKRCFIQNMPNILILTLKRFQFDFDSQSRHKLNDYFEFPFELDMHKYSAAFLRRKQQSSDSKYKLTGMLVHSGSAESGHYYSYVKIGQQWYQFNDKVVSEFNIQNNLKNQCFGCSQGKKTRSAYMLFYEKVHTQYHGVYLNQIPQSNFYKRQINQENAIFLKTRLIYDQNFKKLLQSMVKYSEDARLQDFLDLLFGKKNKMKMQQKQNGMIYFDAEDEDKAPLMQDDLDQFLN